MVEYLPGDVMRVTVQMARPFRAAGGTHIWLYVPAAARWMSHPFAVAWDNMPLDLLVKESRRRTGKESFRDETEEVKTETVTLLIKRRRGMTRKLGEMALKARGNLIVNAAVEGPYSSMWFAYDAELR